MTINYIYNFIFKNIKFVIVGFFCLISSGCSYLFYSPDQLKYSSPKVFGIDYIEHKIASNDGIELTGWELLPKTNKIKNMIIFFHGNAQNISSHFTNLSWAVKNGYGLFIWDYRGYGTSTGTPDQIGIQKDALKVFDYIFNQKKLKASDHYILYGQSLGGIILLQSLIEDPSIQTKAKLLVIDSSFDSYRDLSFEILKSYWPTWPLSPLAYLLISDTKAPKNHLDKITMNTLLIHGDADQVVPYTFAKRLLNAIGSKNKRLWTVNNGLHGDVFFRYKGLYRKKFQQLIENL